MYFHSYIYIMCIFILYTQYLHVYTMIRHVHQDLPGSCVAMMLQLSTEARPATSTDVVVLSPGDPRGCGTGGSFKQMFHPICQAAKKHD